MSSLYGLYGAYMILTLVLVGLPPIINCDAQIYRNRSMIEALSKKVNISTVMIEDLSENINIFKNSQMNLTTNLNDLEAKIGNLKTINQLVKEELKMLITVSKDQKFKQLSTKKLIALSFCGGLNENSKSTTFLLSSCTEATSIAGFFQDNLYLLNALNDDLEPFCAYCIFNATDKNIAWTVIQRREDGSENFNRNWFDYKHGFGNAYGEYWIGLERIHAMTKDQPHELWIELEDYDGVNQQVKYSSFSIASEEDGYRLNVGGYDGRAGDSFGKHNNTKFSTFDVNNNDGKTNCAQKFKGGWWYTNCYYCNLNGFHYSKSNQHTECGINWNDWHGYKTSLKYTHMAIRPIS